MTIAYRYTNSGFENQCPYRKEITIGSTDCANCPNCKKINVINPKDFSIEPSTTASELFNKIQRPVFGTVLCSTDKESESC